MIQFTIVDPDNIKHAFQWHRSLGKDSGVIFPRPWSLFSTICTNEHLWAGTRGEFNYVAQAFYEPNTVNWEVGGVLVHPDERRRGLGKIIVCLTLAHLLVHEWADAPTKKPVVAKVLRSNVARMRPLLVDVLSFKYTGEIKERKEVLPDLPAEADGFVYGELYEMSNPGTIRILARWCRDWDGKLGDGQPAELILPLKGSGLKEWGNALYSMGR